MDFYLFLGTLAATIFTLLCSILYMVYGKIRVQENKIIASPPIMASSSSLSLSLPSSSRSRNWEHDVFPSFHGPDVRKHFLSHIKKEFERKGITPFIDNNIERGESIGPELKRAIQESKIAIVLLSKNYASSSWCLDELVEIMSKVEGQKVLTIFYEVDPTDVKKQTGDFGKVFKKTCRGKTKKKIETWRKALEGVATIAGYHSRNWDDEAVMIENIAVDISKMLIHSAPSHDLDCLIGMEGHMERMEQFLRLDLDEVRMIGIWGPPGIGKSTIARFLFNQLSNRFKLKAIIVNIKRSYPRPCLDEGDAQLQLQSKMLSQMINHKDIMITHLGVAQERLKDKEVLLILDDVDCSAQLDALAKNVRWFGPRSRIIITTEDLKLLKAHGINHVYKVDFPSDDEALEMFCMYAFDQKYPKDGFVGLSREVTFLAGKLPLGLKVMGSYFRGMSKYEWERVLPNLWSHLDGEINTVLKFSYDALCDEDKNLFLHIACYFNYVEVKKVEEHLANKFLDVRQRLDVLADKSLISLNWNIIIMHTLLVKLGKEINRKQSRDPGQRQFLVNDEDICQVLSDPTAITSSVVGIHFRDGVNRCNLIVNERAFEGMSNLQFLRFKYDSEYPDMASLPGCLKYISPNLQLLHWEYSPMTCLPFTHNLEFLVELIMPHSKLVKLWEGVKLLRNLKWMNLSYSRDLKEIPNLSTATNLQELNLENCSSLMELPSSIGNATNLQNLNLEKCLSLVELPSSIGNAINLQVLNISHCSSLVKLPSSIGNATNLQKLNLSNCSNLVELPSSVGNATNLQDLNLSHCSNLVELPSSIGNATNLQDLNLSHCSNLVELPSSIGNATNLQDLNLSHCSRFVELPSWIGNTTNLMHLNLNHCSRFVELPSSIGNATNLQDLNLSYCSSLEELPSSIGNATNLQNLNLSYCSSLEDLPSSIGNASNLQKINLSYCSNLVELPSSIGNATNLQDLNLSYCSSLEELPSSIGNATNLRNLNLSYCSSLEELPSSIGNATNLQDLDLNHCSSLVKLSFSIGSNLKRLSLDCCLSLVNLPFSIGNATDLQNLNFKKCLSLVELPSSIRNLHRLTSIDLEGCSKLEVLPTNINLKSLRHLNLTDCSSLKSFPEISTNIEYLELTGTAIEEIPSSIRLWSRLDYLELIEMQNLVSLPQLHDSLVVLYAENCKSLERLDCSFSNPDICLIFLSCFKLNQDARDVIIQTSTKFSVLPGGEVPACFTYRAPRSSVTVELNDTSTKFKACILLANTGKDKSRYCLGCVVYCIITSKPNARNRFKQSTSRQMAPIMGNHLYIFDVEAEDVTSTELVFEFKLDTNSDTDTYEIKECGILQHLDLQVDEEYDEVLAMKRDSNLED